MEKCVNPNTHGVEGHPNKINYRGETKCNINEHINPRRHNNPLVIIKKISKGGIFSVWARFFLRQLYKN